MRHRRWLLIGSYRRIPALSHHLPSPLPRHKHLTHWLHPALILYVGVLEMVWQYISRYTPFPIAATRTPLAPPLCPPLPLRSAILVVAPSTSPRLPLLGTRLRIFVGLHCGTLARRPLQARHPRSPRRASSPLSTRCFIAPSPHTTLTRIVWRARLRHRLHFCG
ncbi:hypothetical protein B0H14DRAFT_981273 [Mycena olivaceomarginata]|nr:hypothetical protein B0H14DRAFT_981273 [Mycena olivaceomarginata]